VQVASRLRFDDLEVIADAVAEGMDRPGYLIG
jgi:hypothetical protein